MHLQPLCLTSAASLPSLILFACFKFQVASENVSSLWNPWVQLFVCETAALIVTLIQFFTSSPPDVMEKLPPELAGEWKDFFIVGIYNLLLPMPISITGVCVCVYLFVVFQGSLHISCRQACSESKAPT